MESPRTPRRPPAAKRVLSLDGWQVLRKDSQSSNCCGPSRPIYKRVLRRTASDGASCSWGPSHFAEAQGTGATALPLEDAREFLPSEQGAPEDTKKDKTSRPTQQSLLKILLNFFFPKTGLEEPREKASKKPKGREEPTELREAAKEPGLRKKSRDKKTSRKKHSHRKLGAEEPVGAQDPDAQDQEDLLPKVTTASRAEEVELGPARRGGPESLPIESRCTAIAHSSPGLPSEDSLQKPDQDEVIRKIVELLKKAGDQWEEEVRRSLPATSPKRLPLWEVQVLQPGVATQTPASPTREKSQEKKLNLKNISLKRAASEEPRRVGAAAALSPEPQPRRPGFLPLCVSSHWTTTSGSPDLEKPRVHEALSTDGGGSHPSELPTPLRSKGPPEELLDRAAESREFRRRILVLLRNSGKQEEQRQPQVQKAVENLVPACKKKSQKKATLRRAFSHKRHSSKEPKKMEAVGVSGAATSETRPPRKHGFFPMCVGGHRASISSSSESLEFQEPQAAGGGPAGFSEAQSQAGSHELEEGSPLEGACESKEFIIHRLVALLQDVDVELGNQIRRHPSFKKFFYQFSDSSLRELMTTLHSRKARLLAENGSLSPGRPAPCAFGSLNKFATNHSCVICILMQSRGDYSGHNYAHFLSRKAQENIMSLDGQSPD